MSPQTFHPRDWPGYWDRFLLNFNLVRGDCTSIKRDLRINRYHIICVTRTDMTQQVASITSSHRGLKAFQLRLVGALDRKNLHRSRCEQQGNGVLDPRTKRKGIQVGLKLDFTQIYRQLNWNSFSLCSQASETIHQCPYLLRKNQCHPNMVKRWQLDQQQLKVLLYRVRLAQLSKLYIYFIICLTQHMQFERSFLGMKVTPLGSMPASPMSFFCWSTTNHISLTTPT